MGIETLLIAGIVGGGVLSAAGSLKAGREQANAAVQEGNIKARNIALDVRRKAASAKLSFLSSGFTLEGTPLASIQSIYNTGQQDLSQLRSNVNRSAKNAIWSSRTQALSTLSKTAMSAGAASAAFGAPTDIGAASTGAAPWSGQAWQAGKVF